VLNGNVEALTTNRDISWNMSESSKVIVPPGVDGGDEGKLELCSMLAKQITELEGAIFTAAPGGSSGMEKELEKLRTEYANAGCSKITDHRPE
jgi:hypothetical protein